MSRRIMAWSVGTTLVVVSVWTLYVARSVTIPFLLAFLLAYFLDPAADFLEERRLPRSVAVTAVFVCFLLVAGALLAFLVPAVKAELTKLQDRLPQYAMGLYQLLPESLLQSLDISEAADLQDVFRRLLDLGKNVSADVIGQVAYFVTRAFSSTFSFLLAVLGYFIIPVYLFYLLRDFDAMKARVTELIPARYRQSVLRIAEDVDSVLSGFIRGQITVCLVLAVLYSLGLLLIGIDLALLIGIISGLAFIIPYLGTILGIIAAGLMAIAKFQDLLHPLMVVGWFALVQALEGTVISPRIVGNRVGLHPVGTILAVLFGGELFGFLGLLLAVPVVASVMVLLRVFLSLYLESSFYGAKTESEEA